MDPDLFTKRELKYQMTEAETQTDLTPYDNERILFLEKYLGNKVTSLQSDVYPTAVYRTQTVTTMPGPRGVF